MHATKFYILVGWGVIRGESRYDTACTWRTLGNIIEDIAVPKPKGNTDVVCDIDNSFNISLINYFCRLLKAI